MEFFGQKGGLWGIPDDHTEGGTGTQIPSAVQSDKGQDLAFRVYMNVSYVRT